MDVLVDSSVWVSFFRATRDEEKIARALDYLLTGDEAVVNEVIKTEVVPMMVARGEDASLFDAVRCPDLTVDWAQVRELQVKCLRNGINKVGVTDLVIALDSMRRKIPLFTLDKHFKLIAKVVPQLKLWPK